MVEPAIALQTFAMWRVAVYIIPVPTTVYEMAAEETLLSTTA